MNQKETPKISVVVPVYKVERYLPECIDSILAQSFTDFELILVDDGSPDNCGAMCDAYAEKDSRVRVIHKENGGLSDARNKGIDQAKGQYITFIDSDDYIDTSYLQYLYESALDTGADIVHANHTSSADKMGGNGADRHNVVFKIKQFDRREAIKDFMLYHTQYANVWAKIYKVELFDGVRFPVGKLTEDEYTTYKLILKSQKVICLPKIIYYYRKRQGSIVASFSEKRFDVCNEVPDLLKETLIAADMFDESEYDYKCMRIWLKIYNDFVQGGAYSEYKEPLDELCDKITALKVNGQVWDGKYKFIRWLLKFTPGLYRIIVNRHRGI